MTPMRGVALKILSVVLFVIMSALIKAASEVVPTGEAVFFRSFFAIPVIMVWLAMRGELSSGLRTANPGMHVIRGLVGVSAMGLTFAALGLLPLPEVTALGYAAPLLTVIFAAILLGENVRLFRLTAVCVGLVGVVIVLWPRLTLDSVEGPAMIGVACVMGATVFRSLVQIHIRRMVQTENTAAIVFYFSMTATVISLITVPFGWVVPGPREATMLVASGLIGGVAQICLTSAYRGAEAALLAPFEYASILFAVLIGLAIFNEVPTIEMIIGSSIVVASGLAIILRERYLGLKRYRARPGMTPHG